MGLFTPLAIKIGGISWLPRFLPQITAIDMFLQRITGGRLSLLRLAGLPSMVLTVVGRKSGQPRSTPMLCVPYRQGFLVAGSNFGGPKAPAWVLNVRAADRVTVAVDRVTTEAVPHEVGGEERDEAWAHMLRTWPNYARYAERTDRVIPVFYLAPVAA
ncbi:nitroreductase family deazaflavin-dependent oxidoreductase [Marmoricola sp. RAF53]|uniref:nitroreductase family deazaflavin-dependent oxidoreductase n=1 Tax=Marmoricola sp. RAF53 TaxID=3233059 RepID=UPI003F9C5A50